MTGEEGRERFVLVEEEMRREKRIVVGFPLLVQKGFFPLFIRSFVGEKKEEGGAIMV